MNDSVLDQFRAIVTADSQEQPAEQQPEPSEEESATLEDTELEEVSDVESVEGVEEVEDESESDDSFEELEVYELGDGQYSEDEILSWKDNGLRQSDYTKKTQELAEQRKAFEAERDAERKKLSALTQKVRDLVKVKGEWEADENGIPLHDEDMPAYQRAQAQQSRVNALLDEAMSSSVTAPSQETINREFSRLVEHIPEWTDASKRAEDYGVINEYLSSLGFEGEFSNIIDNRYYRLFRDAAMGRKLKEQGSEIKDKQVKKAPKIVKPKKANQPARKTKAQQARDKFRKSGGRDRDAGKEVFKQFV